MAGNNTQDELFEFEERPVIKGYPELRWTGKHPYTSTQYYPAQLKESYGEPKDGWMNKIFWGDNLQVMSHMLRDYRGKVDLVYIDPPFDSKADYKKKIKLRGKSVTNDSSAFEEKQYGDIWSNDEYLQFMYERLTLIRELLSNSGCVYLHCDHRRVSHLRIILDEVFGPDHFLNMISWRRQIPRGRKVDAVYYPFSADYILIYAKGTGPTWHKQEKESSISLSEAEKKYMKDGGGYFRTSDPGSYTFESLCQLYEQGRLYAPHGGHVIIDSEKRSVYGSNGGTVSVKYYREQRGDRVIEKRVVDNIWDDIPGMGVVSSEFLGYPTQKPERLLQRILEASTNPDDLVFDCFMGSGTTQAVAMKLGRRFIGADINLGSIQTTTKRLLSVADDLGSQVDAGDKYLGFEVYNVNNYDFFRNPVEARDLLIQALDIQPFTNDNVFDGELDGRMVKILPTNRIATRADIEGLVSGLPYSLYDARKEESPSRPVDHITLVCMGHEPDLKAAFEQALSEYVVDVEIVDILRDKKNLEFKRDSEARIEIEGGKLVIKSFYPLNLLNKLSLQKESIGDWRELVDSVLIDWNYDGAVLEPAVRDIPNKNEIVRGIYDVPQDAGTIRVKITDVLSESLEVEVH